MASSSRSTCSTPFAVNKETRNTIVGMIPQVEVRRVDELVRDQPSMIYKRVVFYEKNVQRVLNTLESLDNLTKKGRFKVDSKYQKVNKLFGNRQWENSFHRSHTDGTSLCLRTSYPHPSHISQLQYGYGLAQEGTCFSPMHCDWDDAIDSLITMHGYGVKTWILCPPGHSAKRCEQTLKSLTDLPRFLQDCPKDVRCAVMRPGSTIYLPYGWEHAVLTEQEGQRCSYLLSVGLQPDSERVLNVAKLVKMYLATVSRRSHFSGFLGGT